MGGGILQKNCNFRVDLLYCYYMVPEQRKKQIPYKILPGRRPGEK
ncbi:hypothetical protein CLOSTASPAR_02625 [[Clostridium] asparagiforme DSM 15981]|uniref:Uncharacterized protein n=1 Tax=[Clostridium] asparagiforme DSM 15981 TaxID=518636 RepID=C0D044_9FIRM|nr:hypothetical protein CLOSTASPAR_02625 [[Clostridium] asparagiforme DSM 15981]